MFDHVAAIKLVWFVVCLIGALLVSWKISCRYAKDCLTYEDADNLRSTCMCVCSCSIAITMLGCILL